MGLQGNPHCIEAASFGNLWEPAVQTPEKKVKLELCVCCVCELLPIACTMAWSEGSLAVFAHTQTKGSQERRGR